MFWNKGYREVKMTGLQKMVLSEAIRLVHDGWTLSGKSRNAAISGDHDQAMLYYLDADKKFYMAENWLKGLGGDEMFPYEEKTHYSDEPEAYY